MTAKCNHVVKQTRIVQGHGPMQAIQHTLTHISLNTEVGLKNDLITGCADTH